VHTVYQRKRGWKENEIPNAHCQLRNFDYGKFAQQQKRLPSKFLLSPSGHIEDTTNRRKEAANIFHACALTNSQLN
jgi:hypothetical protein